MVYGAMHRHMAKDIAFDMAAFDSLLACPPKTCLCCGITLAYRAEYRTDVSASIDKVNNPLGYIPGNVQVICWTCQRLKSDCTNPALFRKIADYIDRYALNLSDREQTSE